MLYTINNNSVNNILYVLNKNRKKNPLILTKCHKAFVNIF
jgi:hypothetical protein